MTPLNAGLFLGAWYYALSHWALGLTPPSYAFLGDTLRLWTGIQYPAALTFSVPPASTSCSGFGILTEFPSPTPFGLGLGSDSPRADEPPPGNLGLTAGRFLTCLVATHIGISSRRNSTGPFGPASPSLQRSPTAEPVPEGTSLPVASVPCLSPVIFSAQPRLTSELLRFL